MHERDIALLIEKEHRVLRDWYALNELNPNGMMKIEREDAEKLNSDNFGIFQTVNLFTGSRKKENLSMLVSWAIDMDKGLKEEQEELIKKSPLFPSLVIETKRGHHVYWNTENPNPERYQSILEDRLIPHYNADPNAKDVTRVLRVPGFYHCKNPNDKFMIKVKHWSCAAYSDRVMQYAFQMNEEEEELIKHKNTLRTAFKETDGLWEKVYNMDCEDALNRLSGSEYVQKEQFSFKPVSNGNLNILVNDKSTSCFIDKNKRIGSLSKGGPTVFQFLKWYGRQNKEVVSIMKKVFPELWNQR